MLDTKCVKFISTFIYFLLIISTAANDCENHQINLENIAYRFINNSVPLRYQVYIDPCINDGNFSGYVHIDLVLLRPAENISLHSQNLIFCEEGVYLTTKGGINESFNALKPVKNVEYTSNSLQDSEENLDDSSETVRPSKIVYHIEEQIVTMVFDKYLDPGRYSLEINYMGSINSESVGIYRKSYKEHDGETRIMLLTNFRPMSARRVFPCRDEVSMKSETYFTVQTSLNYSTIMPNTPDNFVEYKEGQRWSHYHPIANTSSFQMNFAVLNNMKNVTKKRGNKNYKIYATASDINSMKLLHDIHEKAMVSMENYTKVNFPLNTFVSLVAPEKVEFLPSSSLGFATSKKSQTAYDEHSGPQKKKDVVLRATWDITNQWFNHLINPVAWKYAWLTEGLTEYLKYCIADKIMPDWKLKDMFAIWELQRRSFIPNKITDSPPLNRNVPNDPRSIQCLFSQSISSTSMSASIMRMLSHFLSEDVFKAGITNLLSTNKYESIEPNDFWEALQIAVNNSKSQESSRLYISEIMRTWVDTEFYPVLNVTRNYKTGSMIVTQKSALLVFNLTEKGIPCRWWIPINYATQSNIDFDKTSPSHWLKPSMDQLEIEGVGVDDWVIFNVQQTGYYRVLYDEKNWKRLAVYLNSENYINIHPINRAQIINDAIQFTLKMHLDMGVFLDLLSYLQRETDYIPWYDAQFIFSFLNYHLSNTHAYESLKNFSLKLITPLVDKIGFEDRPNDDFSTLLLRRISNHWACYFGYKPCWESATKQLEDYLDNNKAKLGPDDLQEWARCVGLNGANRTTWDKMFMKYQKTLSEDTLIYLACSEDPVILHDFLNLTVSNCSIVPEKQVMSVFKAVCLYPTGNDKRINLCLNFINNEFDNIKSRLGNSTESLIYLLDLLASEVRQRSQLNQFQNFLAQDRINFAAPKLTARIKQTESRVNIFEQKANYYKPYLNEKLLQFQ